MFFDTHIRWGSVSHVRTQGSGARPAVVCSPTMTSGSSFDGDVTTVEEFEAALGTLLVEALHNDIDPRGAWEFRAGGAPPDWEVMVVELQTRDEPD